MATGVALERNAMTPSSPFDPASFPEQRREPRIPCNQTGEYLKSVVTGEVVAFEEGCATVLNKSVEGMLLCLPLSFDPGRILEITLERAGHHHVTTVLEVCWSKLREHDMQADQYLVGCRSLFAYLS
jgi:hypothetical protein